MSLRVDLYPIAMPKLTALFGVDGWTHGRAIIDELRAKGRKLDDSLVDELLYGRLRASQPAIEDAALAALIGALAYHVREPAPAVMFDVGGPWNGLEAITAALPDPERALHDVLLHGRPLVGATLRSDWNRYAWIASTELDTFDRLLARIDRTPRGMAFMLEDELLPWLVEVRASGAAVFVSIG